MHYIIDYDICALIISTITMLFFFLSPRLFHQQDNIFGVIGVLIVASSTLDMVGVCLNGIVPTFLCYIINMLYLCSLHSLPIMMLLYIMITTDRLDSLGTIPKIIIALPYAIEMLLIVTSPATHLVFYVMNGWYYQSHLAFVLYICAAMYICLSFVVIHFSKDNASGRKVIAISSFIVLQIGAMGYQFFNPNYLMVNFAASLSLIIMYIALQSSSEISDTTTKAYNMKGFLAFTNKRFSAHKTFKVVGYQICGFRQINELYGDDCGTELMCYCKEMLARHFGGRICRTYDNEFAIIIDKNIDLNELKHFSRALPKQWSYNDNDIQLVSSIALLDSKDFSSGSEILELMDLAFQTSENSGGGKIIVVDYDLKSKHNRKILIRNAIARAIEEDRVNVFYQPIIDCETGKTIAAEALCRITDPVLGAISPAEFIPLAEETTLILDLDRCVRKKVWRFLTEYDIRSAGLDHISINLSSLECVQQSVMEEILLTDGLSLIEKGIVNFEITETAAITSRELLTQNMDMLLENGYLFHLDDYGTGYAGMSNLISLPFNVIKLDKSILDLSENESKRDFVKRLITPFHAYGLKIVCEGIESIAQAQMAMDWGVDYLQGYLYSKPLSQKDFIAFANIGRRTSLSVH